MRPSVVLDANRIAVREAVARYRATNPRIFGSVLRGQDHEGSVSTCWSMPYPALPCLTWVVSRKNSNRCSACASMY